VAAAEGVGAAMEAAPGAAATGVAEMEAAATEEAVGATANGAAAVVLSVEPIPADGFDLILSSDTIYDVESTQRLWGLIK